DAVTIPAAVLHEVNALSDPTGQGYHGLGNTVTQRITYGNTGSGVIGASAMIHAHRSGRAGRPQRPRPSKALRQAALRRADLRARSGGWTGYAPLRRANLFSIGWPGAEVDQARIGLIRLLALGAPFQCRLSATVAHAWSASGERADRWQRERPALTAA